MRNEFNHELEELGALLTEMAGAAENAIDVVTASLTDPNREAADQALAITKIWIGWSVISKTAV